MRKIITITILCLIIAGVFAADKAWYNYKAAKIFPPIAEKQEVSWLSISTYF